MIQKQACKNESEKNTRDRDSKNNYYNENIQSNFNDFKGDNINSKNFTNTFNNNSTNNHLNTVDQETFVTENNGENMEIIKTSPEK